MKDQIIPKNKQTKNNSKSFESKRTDSVKVLGEKQNVYDHQSVEKYWQDIWKKEGLYSPDLNSAGNSFYNLWMFPYPSAEGLHAGHAFASTGSDVYGRFMRMHGKTVFQPIGYDSFGIHSENYALKIGENPGTVVERTTKHYEEQLRSLGHGYDWTRTVTTSNTSYYHWTEWLFVTLFKAGLAYRKSAEVNFCPSCKTVLADEQVMSAKQAGKEPKDASGNIISGSEDIKVCERCGTVSERRELKQWFFRITSYAERLLANLGKIDWSERVKVAQKEWIGKKEGVNITYKIDDSDENVVIWTSRPDTNFGATFIVLAPENPLVLKITTQEHIKEVNEYIKLSKSKSKEERLAEGKEKTGAFTGSYAINNLNGYKMPVYVTDFVLSDVGTGAVVGVPGHDIRDFQFAKKFKLPVIRVVEGIDGDKSEITQENQVQEEEGKMINSEFLNGMDIHAATVKIMDYFEEKGWGERTTSFHLRDWLISRQRYWGCPIPMIYCRKCAKEGKSWFTSLTQCPTLKLIHKDQSNWESAGWYPVPDEDLPVILPKIKDWKPEGTGKGPLANHPDYFKTKCPGCGGEAERETDVADTFLDSSWYFLRYPSVVAQTSDTLPFDPQITRDILPVNLYFGGAEHSVLHLMYARFVTMAIHDLGHINFEEPFPKFFAHGLMIKDGAKMSKSRGNVVNPDEYVSKFGADALRFYLMFMGPMDGYPDFRDTGIEGMRRFVDKLWNLFGRIDGEAKEDKELTIKMHKTIKGVTGDIENFDYNTAIALIMEYVNAIKEKENYAPIYFETLVKLIAPFAPHLSEEIWRKTFKSGSSIHTSEWPTYDPRYLKEDQITIIIQVNGKLRSSLVADSSLSKEEIISLAKEDSKTKVWLTDKKIIKEIFVPGRLVNFVIG